MFEAEQDRAGLWVCRLSLLLQNDRVSGDPLKEVRSVRSIHKLHIHVVNPCTSKKTETTLEYTRIYLEDPRSI